MEMIPYTCIDREMLLSVSGHFVGTGDVRGIRYLPICVGFAVCIIWRWRKGRLLFPLFVQGDFHGSGEQTEEGVACRRYLRLLMTASAGCSGVAENTAGIVFDVLVLRYGVCGFRSFEKGDIRDGVLKYNRQKTGTPMLVEIQPVARRVVGCVMYTLRDSPYLFTFLSGTKTGEEAYREYTSALADFNRSLEVAGECLWCDGNSYLIFDPSLFRHDLEGTGCTDRDDQRIVGT